MAEKGQNPYLKGGNTMENRNLSNGQPKPLLVYFVAIYAASLLIANVLANHMLGAGWFQTNAGILTFPITYIIASILAEVYGYKWARRAAWLSLALNALLAILIQISILLPQPVWYDGIYFAQGVGGTLRIVVASLTAFTIGKFANDRIFIHLKGKNTGMEGFKFRAMASSIVGHVFDTTIFLFIAFGSIPIWRDLPGTVMPWSDLPWNIFIGVCLKWGYEWLALPLTVFIVKRVKNYEGVS